MGINGIAELQFRDCLKEVTQENTDISDCHKAVMAQHTYECTCVLTFPYPKRAIA